MTLLPFGSYHDGHVLNWDWNLSKRSEPIALIELSYASGFPPTVAQPEARCQTAPGFFRFGTLELRMLSPQPGEKALHPG
jgi:hypothetical protein